MIHGLLDQIQPGASDEEDDERDATEFCFVSPANGSGPDPATFKVIVVCAPGAASAFGLSSLANRPLPWTLEAKKGEPVFPLPPKSPRFFACRDVDHAALAVLDTSVAPEFAAAWCATFLQTFAGAEVVFLDRVFRASWQADGESERPKEPHLACLWSSACASGGLRGLQPLPLPNVLEGLGAALITSCEADRRTCVCALTVQDGAHLGEGCVRAFEALAPLLLELGVVSQGWRIPNLREAVRQVVPPASMNIYA